MPNMLDPNTTTRENFTKGLTEFQLPDGANQDWLFYVNKNRELLKKLAAHPAMEPNLQQTYSTPANNKNRVYFMWDFVGRTLGMLYNIGPLSKGISELSDTMSRTWMARELILDSKPGMMNMMVEATNPEQKGKHPDFGEEIIEIAKSIRPDDK